MKIIEGKRPDMPSKFAIQGRGDRVLDIDLGSIKADKSDPLAVTHYRFEMVFKDDFDKNDGEWKSPFIKDKAVSNMTYMLVDLKPNTTYLVRVASLNRVGLSDWTEIKQFTTLDKKPEPEKTSGCAGNVSHHIHLVAILLAIANRLATN
jgi:hypothetical protein